MRFIAHRAVAAAALFLGLPAAAQEAPAPPPDEIVVTGTRDREQQVRDFVGALKPTRGGSVPRFVDALCPVATGLLPVQRDAIAARLRRVAAAAGIRVAPADCAPNMFVIVTPDKRAFIEILARKRPDSFAAMSPGAIARLARSPGPAAAWQLEGPVSAAGVPLQWDDATGTYRNPTTEATGRLKADIRRGFDAAALVVELGALDGLAPAQLADYAAMRLLAKLDPARLPPNAPATILTVLTAPMGSPVAGSVTTWDLGLLRGLYAAPPDASAASQRGQIAERVMRDLDAPKPDAP